MGQPDHRDTTLHDDEDGMTVTRLGPPGWAEFVGARERFMRTLEIGALERSWSASALEPARPQQGDGRG
jgi:hypothetical protein